MLVLNAGNLMKSVTAVVKAAESASIKSRLSETDKMKLRWVRRRPQWLTVAPRTSASSSAAPLSQAQAQTPPQPVARTSHLMAQRSTD